MRVRYTVPGWQPTMPRGVAPVRPPIAFREMVRSRQEIPDTDWKTPLRAASRQSLRPELEKPPYVRGAEVQTAETARPGMRTIAHRLPAAGGPAVESLRVLLQELATMENRILLRAAGGSTRG
jgi:hypothetical protein